jgi:hypothetical protein
MGWEKELQSEVDKIMSNREEAERIVKAYWNALDNVDTFERKAIRLERKVAKLEKKLQKD